MTPTHERTGMPVLGLVGGECSGKTTLGLALADRLNGIHVPEALRLFVDREGRPPLEAEQAAIMFSQESAEAASVAQATRSGGGAVICDPAALMTAIYSVAYFEDESLLPSALTYATRYDLVIWCDTAFPWKADGVQRDGPAHRARVDGIIRDVLAQADLPVVRAVGGVEHRVSTVLAALSGPDQSAQARGSQG